MSLLNNNKTKDKKKAVPVANKPGMSIPKGKGSTQSAPKATRINNRSQRGS